MVQAIRGMRDVLPEEARRWREVESALESVIGSYAYEEVHLPLLEFTELFERSVGEVTDIVEKEMYTFEDRDGERISLRPEGTAGCVRMLEQHGLLYNQIQRVFYRGPMFRYERPQKGRYRQFYQLGVEAFGLAGPDVDAELLLMGQACWRRLGIDDSVRLELNTLGTAECRSRYREALVSYLQRFEADLDADSRRRLKTNPLRILDSKHARTREILAGAPTLADYLDDASRRHFDSLRQLLDEQGVSYRLNSALVRGLDYYTHAVFEWTTDQLGAQGTICGGGRYDGLVAQLGGRPTPAAGFALGLERVLLLYEQRNLPAAPAADIYLCVADPALQGYGLTLGERLRAALPELRIRVHAGGGKLKSQLRKADQCKATWAVIVGDEEFTTGTLTVKTLATGAQETVSLDAAIDRFQTASSRNSD